MIVKIFNAHLCPWSDTPDATAGMAVSAEPAIPANPFPLSDDLCGEAYARTEHQNT